MVELSMQNESYRVKVANLGAQLDKTNTELKAAQSQSSWINADLSNIHQMASQLSEQKTELQTQIAEQNREIEELNSEIRGLRTEVFDLTNQVKEEREKTRTPPGQHFPFTARPDSSKRT